MVEEQLTNGEKEVLILQAAIESIKSSVNHSMFKLHSDGLILFNTGIHQKYFNILLLDFLKLKIFKVDENCIKALQMVSNNPQYNQDVSYLKDAVCGFEGWLYQEVKFEHEGEVRKLWFPSINCNIALKITRIEFIEVCGNISKHNPLGLERQAKLIQKIFEKNDVSIEITDSILLMEEFYQQFHDDLLNYHSSTIAEFLNNIWWAIYEYLQPLYIKCISSHWDEQLHLDRYEYIYPDNIKNSYIKSLFWDLMNNVRSKPYIQRFAVNKYLKMRY